MSPSPIRTSDKAAVNGIGAKCRSHCTSTGCSVAQPIRAAPPIATLRTAAASAMRERKRALSVMDGRMEPHQKVCDRRYPNPAPGPTESDSPTGSRPGHRRPRLWQTYLLGIRPPNPRAGRKDLRLGRPAILGPMRHMSRAIGGATGRWARLRGRLGLGQRLRTCAQKSLAVSVPICVDMVKALGSLQDRYRASLWAGSPSSRS